MAFSKAHTSAKADVAKLLLFKNAGDRLSSQAECGGAPPT